MAKSDFFLARSVETNDFAAEKTDFATLKADFAFYLVDLAISKSDFATSFHACFSFWWRGHLLCGEV